MSFSPDEGTYGPQGNWAPGMQPPGNWSQRQQSPGVPGQRGGAPSTFARLTAPILLLVLGLTGFFLGFAPAGSYEGFRGDSRESYAMFDGYLLVFPVLVLIAGLIGIAGLIPRERPQLWLTTVISVATAGTMLCLLPSFDDGESTAWAYWVVFVILLAQAGIALFAIFIGAGVITVRPKRPAMAGNWPGPQYAGPPSPQFPMSGPQMQPPPPAPHPDTPPPAEH